MQVDAGNSIYEANVNNNLSMPVSGVVVFPTQAPHLAAPGFTTNGEFQLAVYGEAGQTYALQVSTNLVNWQTVTNFVGSDSPFYFSDPAATNYSRRFYRAQMEP